MKFRLLCILLAATLLTGCGTVVSDAPAQTVREYVTPVPSDDVSAQVLSAPSDDASPLPGTLEYLRAQAAQEGCICAIAEAYSEVMEQYPFLADADLISVSELSTYAVVPVDPGASVRIDEISFGGEDFIEVVTVPDGFHYEGGAEPFLLRCGENDFISDVRITVTDSQGRSAIFEPWHNGMNGYLAVSSVIYDFTPYGNAEFLDFTLGEIDDDDHSSWYNEIDFSDEQAQRLILGLRAMGWSMHKIVHFLNYVAYGNDACLEYVGPLDTSILDE